MFQLADLIDRHFPTIAANVGIEVAIAQLNQANHHPLLVVEVDRSNHFIGIFTDQIVVQLLAEKRSFQSLVVRDVMDQLVPFLRLAELENIASVLTLFQQKIVVGLPVLDDQGSLIGWLSCQKLLQFLGKEMSDRKWADIALRKQLNRTLLLQKVTDAIRSQLDPQQVFEATVKQVGMAFNANRCLLMTYKVNPYPQFLVAAEYVEPGDLPLPIRTLLFKKNAYAETVLSEDQAVVSANVYANPLLQPMEALCQHFGLKSMLTVRTSYQGKPNGALSLHQCNSFRDWTTNEIQLFEAIAAQVGIALAQVQLLEQEKAQREAINEQNIRLKQEIQKRNRVETALSRSNAALQAQQEAALDGILVVDENRQIASFNRRFCEVWNIPMQWMHHFDFPTLLQHILERLKEPQEFLERIAYLEAHPNEISHEEISLNHDRVLDRYSAPVKSLKGDCYGRVWFFRDITERKQTERRLAQRERYLAVLVDIQRCLLASNSIQPGYTTILQKLGQASGADRVYLFENHRSATNVLLMSQRVEWCAVGIQAELNNPILQNLPYDDFFPRWTRALPKGESINGIVANFPECERVVLEPQGIQAMLVLPLMVNQTFWGFIGFDNCTEARQWTPSEVSLLSVAASAIALHQERLQAEVYLRQSISRERATLRVIEQMRQTLDLDKIFNATVKELRQLLRCDRVLIFRFNPNWSGVVVAESFVSPWPALMQSGSSNHPMLHEICKGDRCQIQNWGNLYAAVSTHTRETEQISIENQYICVDNIDTANLSVPYLKFLKWLQAKAYLVVPIYHGNCLWGLLSSYQNAQPRQWEVSEANLVMHISTQLGIALQQAELFNQTQKQSSDLEKARDAAEAANRAKSEFLANVSHELRTPLNAILGFTQVMSHDVVNVKHREYINIINRSGQHLLKLINDVLEMSKIEAGRHRLNPTSFDFYRLLDTLYEMLSLKARVKHLTLTFEIASDVPQYITTDENKLHQVLLNLLGNAVKFTQIGHVTLRVLAEPNPVAEQRQRAGLALRSQEPYLPSFPVLPVTLFFEVQDSGLGIASEDIEDLFTPFVQTHTGQQFFEGTGLGLAISQQFVQLMGGAIAVESVPDQGSCFRFNIVVTSAPPNEFKSIPPVQSVIGLKPQQPTYRILVMEDHWENQQLLVEMLQPVGFEVQVASNGADGLKVWEAWQPHLILMDIRMPVMDGYEATRRIKALTPGQSPIIIAITSSAFEEDRIAILSVGCNDFISKPFQEEVIFAKLAEHLGVQYLYEHHPTTEFKEAIAPTPNTELITHALKKMPHHWIEQLYEAAVQGRDTLILELIEGMPTIDRELSKELTALAKSFQFEDIIQLIAY